MQQNYITIFVNGEPFHCNKLMSMKDLLLYLGFNLDLIIIEYNKEILHADLYTNCWLKSNDAIEVITIVGGG